MEAYAGYVNDITDLNTSSSGGVSSLLMKKFIEDDSIVYGVRYSDDFYHVIYDYAEKKKDISVFKGSKYSESLKMVKREGKTIKVFEDVLNQLKINKKVLFFGLGCDIYVLKQFLIKNNMSDNNLFSVELICDGVVPSKVYAEYIKQLEKKISEKVVYINLRNKNNGWLDSNINVKFQSGKECNYPFMYSDFGIAFNYYKCKKCYQCRYKGESNHQGDIVIGDYWGCTNGMKEFNKNGVSLVICNTNKGEKLVKLLDCSEFTLFETDIEYALKNQPRFFTPHQYYDMWDQINESIDNEGLEKSIQKIRKLCCPDRIKNSAFKKFYVWGTGSYFQSRAQFILDIHDIDALIDSDKNKFGREINGIKCLSPERIEKNNDVFIVIAIQNKEMLIQVINYLVDKEIYNFDTLDNWLFYGREMLFEKREEEG